MMRHRRFWTAQWYHHLLICALDELRKAPALVFPILQVLTLLRLGSLQPHNTNNERSFEPPFIAFLFYVFHYDARKNSPPSSSLCQHPFQRPN